MRAVDGGDSAIEAFREDAKTDARPYRGSSESLERFVGDVQVELGLSGQPFIMARLRTVPKLCRPGPAFNIGVVLDAHGGISPVGNLMHNTLKDNGWFFRFYSREHTNQAVSRHVGLVL